MTILKYLAVQIAAYAIEMGVFLLSLYFTLVGPISANVISKICAGGFAFFAQRSFTFNVSGDAGVGRQAVRYVLVLFANIPISSLILGMCLTWISNVTVAKIISDMISVAITFTLSKYFIFNRPSRPCSP